MIKYRLTRWASTLSPQVRHTLRNTFDDVVLNGKRGLVASAIWKVTVGDITIREAAWSAARESEDRLWYGDVLTLAVRAAALNSRPKGLSAEYDLIKGQFDAAFYFSKYPEVLHKRYDPVAHYIKIGVVKGYDPSPLFSTKRYLVRYNSVNFKGLTPFGYWLKEGAAQGHIAVPFDNFTPLARMMGKKPAEMQALLTERHKDLRERLEKGALGEMVSKASMLDPLIAHTWPSAINVRIPPFSTRIHVHRMAALYKLHGQAQFRRAKYIILVNRPRWGGARRAEGHLAYALEKLHKAAEVVVISTDQSGLMPEGKFPADTRYIDFPSCTKPLDKAQTERTFVEFVRSLKPDAIFSINSKLWWEILPTYGKALSEKIKLFSVMFCNDKNYLGYWSGYPAKQTYRNFDVLDAICVDSHCLGQEIIERYQVPPALHAKVQVLSAPVDPTIGIAGVPAGNARPQIFWSGRFDPQKRIDLVYAIARAMPEADFRMWGEPVMTRDVPADKPSNVHREGVYKKFDELPLDQADLWLYTSEWDGVPSILLELSMTGVPIVGSEVGGTGEVLKSGMSWPIRDINDVQAYLTAISEILEDPSAARKKALRLREALIAERDEARYIESVARLIAPEGSARA